MTIWDIPSFMFIPFFGGVGVALLAAPLGTLMVWQRLSFFGDTMAHGALVGVAAAILLDQPIRFGIIGFVLLVALLMTIITWYENFMVDTWLIVLSHGALGLGLFMLSLTQYSFIDLSGYLFGDILLTSWTDIQWIYGGLFIVSITLYKLWRPLLLVIFNEELASVQGYNTPLIRFMFLSLLGCAIGISLKIAGALLLTTLFIFPAAIARPYARSPEGMMLTACIMGAVMFASGFFVSYHFDLPTSPAIVVCGIGLLSISRIIFMFFRRGNRLI